MTQDELHDALLTAKHKHRFQSKDIAQLARINRYQAERLLSGSRRMLASEFIEMARALIEDGDYSLADLIFKP